MVKLSQEGLADAAGLDRTFISALERGRKNPTLKTIVRVAEALGVTPSVLLAAMQEIAAEQALDGGDRGDAV